MDRTLFEEYEEFIYIGFHGALFSADKYRGTSRKTAGILNIIVTTLLLPWFFSHRIAYRLINSSNFNLWRKFWWLVFTVVSLAFDTGILGLGIAGLVFGVKVRNLSNDPINQLALVAGFIFMCGMIYLALYRVKEPFTKEPVYEPIEIEEEEEVEENIPELYFCQIFRLDKKTDLHIVKVEYCPDETAFIRIVTDDSFTPTYRRKVKRDKRGERYITFNNQNFYLDDKKTQPVMPEVKK